MRINLLSVMSSGPHFHSQSPFKSRIFLRYFSNEIRRQDIFIPMEKIIFGFSKSSGPGGQNVNKLNTKAEIRFHVDEADWITHETKQRLKIYQENRITNTGDLIITCQEHRTQGHNKQECIKKLQEIIAEAMIEPKDRNVWEGIGEKGKQIRREEKRKRSGVKQARRVSKNDLDF